jgi:hypothetical protein
MRFTANQVDNEHFRILSEKWEIIQNCLEIINKRLLDNANPQV